MNRRTLSRIKSTLNLSLDLDLEALIEKGAPAAFDSIRDEIAAVPADALLHINVDIPRAARRGLVVAERIAPLLPSMSTMGHLAYDKIEKLPKYALALLYAHDRAERPNDGRVPLAQLVQEAVPLRLDLLVTAVMLAHFGLVSRQRVADIRRGQGHADTANDLLALSVLLAEDWKSIEDKVVVTRAQVDRAIPLSAQLQQAIGVRESDADPLAQRTDARHVRAQAYTLFIGAYDECRRGVSHLRWHEGDAARIVPSLYPRRSGGSKTNAVPADDAANELLYAGSVDEPNDAPAPQPTPKPITETAAVHLVDE